MSARAVHRSIFMTVALAIGAAALGCRTPNPASQQAGSEVAPLPIPMPAPAPVHPEPPATKTDAAAPAPPIPEERRVLLLEGGAGGTERWIEEADALAAGYTLVDLSDDWTPFIFAPQRTSAGVPLPNRYRRVFIGLANDQLDEDGRPLAAGEKNYLELYGIFPSLSVLRARFIEDGERSCHDTTTAAALVAAETVSYVSPGGVQADEARIRRIRRDLEQARQRAKVSTLAELAALDPKLAPQVKLLEKRAAEKIAMTEVERQLTCEGFLDPPGRHPKGARRERHQPGVYDDAIRLAVRRFQQKHMIDESHYLRRKTMEALARPPLENDHQSLLRVLRERVVSAASVIEDGTAGGVPNLADEYTALAAEQLGLATLDGAIRFFRKHPASDFRRLRAAVKLPPPPDYYAPNMNLSIVIDRGDVWYDLPFDESGNPRPQPRKKYPQLTLFVRSSKGQQIPLVKWRTTIGGWRADQAPDGYEYYRYKGSDVGTRVIRQIIAGPVWIAPASTPIRSLVKSRQIGRYEERVVNYEELGPGYLSAYGVVAGYFVVPGVNGHPDVDNGIRAHGSSEYLSMYSANGYSHGCHRLPNHLAIRLYSFILKHRPMRVVGDLPTEFTRQFFRDERVFEIKIPSRGYAYVMDPPIPVNVLEGEIKGEAKTPILGYVPKPGVVYPGPPPAIEEAESPEARAAGAPPVKAKGALPEESDEKP
jgi:hypothetical protein